MTEYKYWQYYKTISNIWNDFGENTNTTIEEAYQNYRKNGQNPQYTDGGCVIDFNALMLYNTEIRFVVKIRRNIRLDD